MKKNIVFFHAESWDGRKLGVAGHPAFANATPNIDRIARGGAFFENAYCSHPVCCPSRANMWSGRYTHNCESWNNHKGLEPGMWSLLEQIPETHEFASFGKLDYLCGGHTIMARLGAWLSPASIEKPIFDRCASQDFEVDGSRTKRFHEEDWAKIDNAIKFMKEKSSEKKPFFLYVSAARVHPKFHTNRYWLEKIPEDRVDIPPLDFNEHPARRYQAMSKAWRHGFSESTVQRVRRIYFAMCAEADAMAGELYSAMEELGINDNTYFIFSSDHGELALEHGQHYKMSLYEGSVRVPLVISGPGIKKAVRRAEIVSLIDICPTLMEMAEIPAREGLDGESILPAAEGKVSPNRNHAYACFTGITLNTSSYMLRRGDWKYTAYADFPPELFNLKEDPLELKNKAENEPRLISEMDRILKGIVDYRKTHRDLLRYDKNAFAEWRRQAKRGLYVDNSYSLRRKPSSDYMKIMDNCFTGYNQEDEEKVDEWIKKD